MKKLLPVFIALIFSNYNFSQEKIPFIDYETIIKAANESSQNGEYEKALEHISRLNPNDSMYWDVMVNKTYYLLMLQKFDDVITLADRALKEDQIDIQSSFFINKSVALIRQSKYEEAIKVCDDGLKRFPMNKTLWYNKGVCYEGLNSFTEAIELYKKVILIDPTYKQTYLQLGNICYKQELISQALMCYNMYLLLEPNAEGAFETLKSLNNIVASKNDNVRNNEFSVSSDDQSFEDIDLIISNRIALNENYETGNEIDIALTKQNHALLESLKNYEGNSGFWAKKLVPFYQWIIDNNHFDVFTYTLSYSIRNETYKKIVEKNEDQISQFHNEAIQEWTELAQKSTETWDGNEEDLTYYFLNGSLEGIGKMNDGNPEGLWQFYSPEGRLKGKGNFSASGKRDGQWVFYNTKGGIQENAHYIDGILDGENLYFFENGKPEIIATYKDDLLSGEYKSFRKAGSLDQKKFFKNGKLNGTYQTFYEVGEDLLKNRVEYIDGNASGKYTEYYPTGDIKYEMLYSQGKANGQEIGYYPNGTISYELINQNDSGNGPYKEYHSNGNVREIGHIINGFYTGHWQTFYSDGTLKSDFEYGEEGKINGEYKYYDRDGKIHYTYEYRKGEIIAYTFFDKSGNVIEENRKKGGEFTYNGYTPYGKKTSEGLYDIKGGKIGNWKFYSKYGNLTGEGNYEDNKIIGLYKGYYENGSPFSITNYINDTLSGYYVEYHKNGQIKSQGWYKEDKAHGEWRTYFLNGTLSEINFFHKGLLHGVQQRFSVSGIKKGLSVYKFGDIVQDITYDIDGTIINDINYLKNEGSYEITLYHNNGKPGTKISYTNGIMNGPYIHYDFYGSTKVSGQYLNGQQHGEWIWYGDDDKVESKANYLNGTRHGETVYYFDNGSIDVRYIYDFGEVNGEVISYHDNGSIYTKSNYLDDEVHGRRETYDEDGNLQLIRFYEHGRLFGYSYLDKNSEELAMIPIENESGKIISYYNNGKVSREFEYLNGELVNEFKEYYYSGQLMEELNYADGEINGNRFEYFQNGSLKLEEQYILGKQNGTAKEYYENGGVKKTQNYILDVKDGISKFFDPNGKLTKEETYFDDKVISAKTY